MSAAATGNSRTLAFYWGLGGFIALLVYAIARLAPIAWEALQQPMSLLQLAVLAGNTLFMAYSEGYKGFQKGYSPRVVARAAWLKDNATVWLTVLAPLFCMAYFAAPRKRLLTTWILTIAIIILVIIFHRLPQPWRGILDAGVVVGLSWGIIATLVAAGRYLLSGEPPGDPEVKDSRLFTSINRTVEQKG